MNFQLTCLFFPKFCFYSHFSLKCDIIHCTQKSIQYNAIQYNTVQWNAIQYTDEFRRGLMLLEIKPNWMTWGSFQGVQSVSHGNICRAHDYEVTVGHTSWTSNESVNMSNFYLVWKHMTNNVKTENLSTELLNWLCIHSSLPEHRHFPRIRIYSLLLCFAFIVSSQGSFGFSRRMWSSNRHSIKPLHQILVQVLKHHSSWFFVILFFWTEMVY